MFTFEEYMNGVWEEKSEKELDAIHEVLGAILSKVELPEKAYEEIYGAYEATMTE